MMKGSRVRHCKVCGKQIFWIIPAGDNTGGIQFATTKEIRPFKMVKAGYYCKECYNKKKV